MGDKHEGDDGSGEQVAQGKMIADVPKYTTSAVCPTNTAMDEPKERNTRHRIPNG